MTPPPTGVVDVTAVAASVLMLDRIGTEQPVMASTERYDW
jgi:hypothetical protein